MAVTPAQGVRPGIGPVNKPKGLVPWILLAGNQPGLALA